LAHYETAPLPATEIEATKFLEDVDAAKGDIVKVIAEVAPWTDYTFTFPIRDGSHRTSYTIEYATAYPDDAKYDRLYTQLWTTNTEMHDKADQLIDRIAVQVRTPFFSPFRF
jgi:hypothetical protein